MGFGGQFVVVQGAKNVWISFSLAPTGPINLIGSSNPKVQVDFGGGGGDGVATLHHHTWATIIHSQILNVTIRGQKGQLLLANPRGIFLLAYILEGEKLHFYDP